MYRGLKNRVRRLEIKTQPKGLRIFIVEQIDGLYHVKRNGELMNELTPKEFEQWKQENDDEHTLIIEVTWADDDEA